MTMAEKKGILVELDPRDGVRAMNFLVTRQSMYEVDKTGEKLGPYLELTIDTKALIEGGFLHRMVDVVGAVMGDAYPEVRAHAAQCRSVIRAEEEGFASVYRQGMQRLQ